MELSDLQYRIARLELNPGDIVVLKFDHVLSLAEHAMALDYAKQLVGEEHRIAILDSRVELSVLTKADDPAAKRLTN